jgi:hypothetical protein
VAEEEGHVNVTSKLGRERDILHGAQSKEVVITGSDDGRNDPTKLGFER